LIKTKNINIKTQQKMVILGNIIKIYNNFFLCEHIVQCVVYLSDQSIITPVFSVT